MPDNEFDKYAQDYSVKIDEKLSCFGTDHDFFVRHKAALLAEIFSRSGARPKVLDVGCGVGLVHSALIPAVGELHGVDVSELSLKVARENHPQVSYRGYEGQRLPYPDGSFDAAFAICVLHHVPPAQWQEFVNEMARVVKAGGMVLIIEHNPLNPATQWVVRTCELDEGAVLLTPWRLRRLLTGAGVEAPKLRHILFTPFQHRFFRQVDRLLERVPLGAQYLATGQTKALRPGVEPA